MRAGLLEVEAPGQRFPRVRGVLRHALGQPGGGSHTTRVEHGIREASPQVLAEQMRVEPVGGLGRRFGGEFLDFGFAEAEIAQGIARVRRAGRAVESGQLRGEQAGRVDGIVLRETRGELLGNPLGSLALVGARIEAELRVEGRGIAARRKPLRQRRQRRLGIERGAFEEMPIQLRIHLIRRGVGRDLRQLRIAARACLVLQEGAGGCLLRGVAARARALLGEHAQGAIRALASGA